MCVEKLSTRKCAAHNVRMLILRNKYFLPSLRPTHQTPTLLGSGPDSPLIGQETEKKIKHKENKYKDRWEMVYPAPYC